MTTLAGMPALSASPLHTLVMSPMHSAVDAPAASAPDLVKTYFSLVGNTMDEAYALRPTYFAFGFLPFTAIPNLWNNVDPSPIDPQLYLYTNLSDVYTHGGGPASYSSWTGWNQVLEGASVGTHGDTYPHGETLNNIPSGVYSSTAPPRFIAQYVSPNIVAQWVTDSDTDTGWTGHTVTPHNSSGDNLTRTLSNRWSPLALFNEKLADFLDYAWTPDKTALAALLYNLHQTVWASETPDTGVPTIDDSGETPMSGEGWFGFRPSGGNIGVAGNVTNSASAVCGWRVDLASTNAFTFEGYNFTALSTAACHSNPAPQYYFVARVTFGDYGMLPSALGGGDGQPDAIEFISDGLISAGQWLGNVANENAITIGSEAIPTGGLATNDNGHLRNCVLYVGVIGRNPNTWAEQFGLEMTYPPGVYKRL